jgi:tRNA (uracil-5-)-methyltransferase TRM9
MDTHIACQLVELNHTFYEKFAGSFSESRTQPQAGFYRLHQMHLFDDIHSLLDVGCGNGRFGQFLLSKGMSIEYVGVDFSRELLALGDEETSRFVERDISQPGCLAGLGSFDVIVSFSTLQHIPMKANRVRLVREMKTHLNPNGRLILANWQFLDSPRQRKKIRPWSEIGLAEEDVEPADYLLSWQREGYGLRYVAFLDETAVRSMAEQAGLNIEVNFRSDGREGNLNLFSVLSAGLFQSPEG